MSAAIILACTTLAVVLTLVLVREAQRRMALENLLRRLLSYGRFREKRSACDRDSRHRPGDRLPE